ncbi:hypothetical protein CHUAL_010649 [Chamberlinius hualienensis]
MGITGKKVGFLVAIVFVCLIAIGLIGTSLGTDYWIYQDYRNASVINASDPNTDPVTDILYHINMGLFSGYLDSHFAAVIDRGPFQVKFMNDRYEGFINFGLWISTMLFVCLGIVFALVTVIFSMVNTFTTPIEQITGIFGLYVWNNLACLFTVTGMMTFVGLYIGNLKHVFISLEDDIHFYIEEPSTIGYSFYLVVGASALLLINNIFVFLSTYKVESKKHLPDILGQEGSTDGQIMLY